MPNETTNSEPTPATNVTETPSPLQETPSSTVDNIPQAEGDFATWLSDRLDKFDKGEEAPPWEKKEEEPVTDVEAKAESQDTTETEEEADSAESKEEEPEEKEEDSEETKNMSTAAGAKFKELKNELKEYKSKLAEATKLIEEAKRNPASSEEVDSLKAKLSEYEQEIAITRVEATPEYKRAVLEPTQTILDAASTLAERYKVDARKLVNALREESVTEGSDSLTEMAGDFSERDRVRLYRMADDLSDVARRRDYLRQNAAQAYTETQERIKAEEARLEQEYQNETKRAAATVWDKTFANNTFLKTLPEDVVANIKSAGSEADLLDADPDTRSYAVYAGVALPHLTEQLEASRTKVAELEKALSKYKKASPKVSGNTDTTTTVPEDTGFLDAIEKRFSLG
jgi:hypothetical protein